MAAPGSITTVPEKTSKLVTRQYRLVQGIICSWSWATLILSTANLRPVFTTSARGARMISFQGYKFLRQCESGQKTRWWCGTHNNRGCRANIHTIGSSIVRFKNVHNHPPTVGVTPNYGNNYVYQK
ncbi:unnamed protein product [Leptosia nina]|uniref:FLYWCH-type domain-containing protein n=1 Tax=Leptosia nina TaxID=320188 RepID=A0AAV1J605_9NEOP